MKLNRTLSFVILAAGLFAASQHTLAAAPKADARTAALVAALQAVSPDPLGGRLGLEASATQAAPLLTAPVQRNYAAANTVDRDQRSYAIWKSALKSRS